MNVSFSDGNTSETVTASTGIPGVVTADVQAGKGASIDTVQSVTVSTSSPESVEKQNPTPAPKPEPAESRSTAPVESAPLAPTMAPAEPPPSAVVGSNPFSEPAPPPPAEAPTPQAEVPVVVSEVAEEVCVAWQPFTFSGVANFSQATLSRLLLVQLLVALGVGATVTWFVDRNYAPIVVQAIQQLPEEARLRAGKMDGVLLPLVAEGKFLSLAVDLHPEGNLGRSADLQVELHESNIQIGSLFSSLTGVLSYEYPPNAEFPMSRSSLEPWWGAWHPIIYVSVLVATTAVLLVLWTVIATLYALPVRIMAYFADQHVSLGQCWLVAGAALMPGAFIMILAILLHGYQILDVIGLGVLTALHLVAGWVYALVSPWRMPRAKSLGPVVNPFTPSVST